MHTTSPKSKSIIGYREFYLQEPPEDRISLLTGLCKTVTIGEIAGLKYRLKPKDKKYHDKSFETQQKELFNFCGSNNYLFKIYSLLATKYLKDLNDFDLIFTRQMCLFALEEIINSDLPVIPNFTMAHSWEMLLRYLLAVNNEITKLTGPKNAILTTNIQEKDIFNLETLNPKLIPLNELDIDLDPLYIPYRGHSLLSYLSEHKEMGKYLKEYVFETYNMTYEQLIYEVISMYTTNNPNGTNNITNEFTGEQLDISFYYSVKGDIAKLFSAFSRNYPNKITERLLSIKKYPFYKESDSKFILVDNTLLLDKCYNQFINDYWFDKVKLLKSENGHELYPIKTYRSIIGYFFEYYLKEILKYSFQKAKYYVIKSFDELLVLKTGQRIELTDIYVRKDKRIFIAQAKSSGLYDAEKYEGNIDKLYKNNRKQFFDSFGISQLITSIINLEETALQIDDKFPQNKSYKIYPALIVNEKALQTPLMAQIFNQRFTELLNQIPSSNKVKIFSLSLIHVSDLEQMEDDLCNNPDLFWDILDYNKRNRKFIPPFYNTLNILKVQPTYEKVKNFYEFLIAKFQNKING